MKEINKKLPLKQVLRLVKAHFLVSILIFVFAMIISGALYGNSKIPLVIFTIISMLTYFSSIYQESYNIARQDKKRYTLEEPYKLKGFLLPVGVVVLTIVLYIMHYLIWKYMSMSNIWASLLSTIYVIWTFAFNGIIGLRQGFMAWYGYIIVVFAPVIFSGLGYIAGLKDFDITAKLSKFVYEKKD